jgi:hypothetical protein
MKRNFPADARLVIGCASGVRSLNALELLGNEGYANLVNLAGGFLGARDAMGQVVRPGWQTAGLPCEAQAPHERTYTALRGPE